MNKHIIISISLLFIGVYFFLRTLIQPETFILTPPFITTTIIFITSALSFSFGIDAARKIMKFYKSPRKLYIPIFVIIMALMLFLENFFVIIPISKSQIMILASRSTCTHHLRVLMSAIQMYLVDNNNRFPSANNWCDAIYPYLAPPSNERNYVLEFICPLDHPAKEGLAIERYSSYAFNDKLSNVEVTTLTDSTHTVVLFESENSWNKAGWVELLPSTPRHRSKDLYLFLDNHTEAISRSDIEGFQN